MNWFGGKYKDNKGLQKKVAALFMYFEQGTDGQSLDMKIALCDAWIREFVAFHEFELAAIFRDLREDFKKERDGKEKRN